MLTEVIACNCCREILGQPVEVEQPTVRPSEVYEAENETVEREFADGWMLYVFPDPHDPIALCKRHRCPDCK